MPIQAQRPSSGAAHDVTRRTGVDRHLIRAPLLVIHGRNDVRVPVSEAIQIHDAASDSELLIFDDEGHGIMRHGNRARAYGRALDFVRQRIRA